MGILDKAGLSLDSLNPMTNIPEGLPADQLTPYAYVPENNAPDPYAVQQEYIKDTLGQIEAQKKEVAEQKTKAQEIMADLDATAPWLNAVPEIQGKIDKFREWYATERARQGAKFDNYELQKKANDTKLELDAIKNEHTKIMNQVYANANKIVDPNFYEDNAGEIYRQEVNKVFAENQGKSISELAPKIAAIDLPIKAEALPKWIVSSKVIPGMTSISSTVSETDEKAIQDNAEAAFASATEAKRANIIKVLQKTKNDETGEPYLGNDPSYEEASKAVQDYSMNFYRKRISQPRSTPKSQTTKLQEKYRVEDSQFFETSNGMDDGLTISSGSTPITLLDEDGNKIVVLPNKAALWSTGIPGAYIEGTKIARLGDVSYWSTEREAKDALAEWEKSNSGGSIVEVDNNGKKEYTIVTGENAKAPIGNGAMKIVNYNLDQFKNVYGTDLKERFRKLGDAHDKYNKEKSGSWMNRNFYGVDYDWKKAGK